MRVLEIGEGLSGAYAGLVLSGLGHDVCQVRHGLDRRLDPMESAFYDRGRSILDDPGSLPALSSMADVLLCDLHPQKIAELGLPRDEEAAARVRPGLVAVVVTSLGLHGPHSDFAMSDITDWAAGGLAYTTRRAVPAQEGSDDFCPVLAPGRQPEVLGGIAAALGALAGARLARSTNRAVLVDVSRQEVLASMSHSYFPMLVHSQMLVGGPGHPLQVGWLVPARDGEVYVRTVEVAQWDKLVEWVGSEELLLRGPDGLPLYYSAPEIVRTLLGQWTRQHPKEWLLEEAAARRIPMADPRELADVLGWPQLRDRGAFSEIDAEGRVSTAPRVPLVPGAGARVSTPVTHDELRARWGHGDGPPARGART